MKDIKYLAAYLVPLTQWFSMNWAGNWAWATVILTFGILPILDALMPASPENYSLEIESNRAKNLLFNWLLYICVPINYALLAFFFNALQTRDFGTIETVGLTLGMGIVTGSMGINIAHELGHRSENLHQTLSKLLLLPTLYMHFFIEHNRGHHKHVATDRDPASAKLGQNVYFFWVKSIFGQLRSAYGLERERLEKLGQPVFGWQNEMLRFTLLETAYLAVVGLFFGPAAIPFAIAIACVSIILLETVNYIEHYGLRRKLLPSGRPEPVSPVHSWNSDHEMGRIFLFELTRHSDHHFKSTRKYQVLRHLDASPQLPTGYPGSMLIALVPPLWFWLMDGRARAASEKELSEELLFSPT